MSIVKNVLKRIIQNTPSQNSGGTTLGISKQESYITRVAYEAELLRRFGKNSEKELPHIKMLIITDTHDRLYADQRNLNIMQNTEYDVCFLLGDISNDDIQTILQYVPCEKIFGILGNHDYWDTLETEGIPNIHGKVVTVNGIRIAGFQGSSRYKTGNFPMYTQEESIDIAEEIPAADILISHDKPYTKDCENVAHTGLKGITYYCYKNHVPVVVHGHLHENYEDVLRNGTKVFCRYRVGVIEI